MKNILKISALVLIIALASNSCVKEKHYSIIPAITFNNFIVNSDGSATLTVNFTDGDGDIGYPSGTVNESDFFIIPQYDSTETSGSKWTYYWATDTTSAQFKDTTASGYEIPDITPTGTNKALSGQIQIALGAHDWDPLYPTIHANLRLIVWITDRAGHISNRVTTPYVYY